MSGKLEKKQKTIIGSVFAVIVVVIIVFVVNKYMNKSAAETPEQAVSNFIQCEKDGDFETATDWLNKEGREHISVSFMEELKADLIKDGTTIAYDNISSQGDNALVPVSVYNPNLKGAGPRGELLFNFYTVKEGDGWVIKDIKEIKQ
ncbi:hypothetical protein [Clostridium tarantellae]|uniref:DUF4878 domain-containing protein n=1 Tax=Clostridium tarantellae TaxID=39493 RepID=A0A6I1MR19_9CLOT|nr:hypothetical protein [Clostridium tarantellae]MPQ44662.1 hypothetical protein [Clostridium tarantellae]